MKENFSPFLLFSQGQVHSFIPDFPNSSTPRMGKWGMVIYHQSMVVPLYSSFPHTFFTCSNCRFSQTAASLRQCSPALVWGCSVISALTWSPACCTGVSAPGPGASPLPPPPLTWGLAELFLTFLSPLHCVPSCPELNTLSQRHSSLAHGSGVPAAAPGAVWSCPCSALTSPALPSASTSLQTHSAPGF